MRDGENPPKRNHLYIVLVVIVIVIIVAISMWYKWRPNRERTTPPPPTPKAAAPTSSRPSHPLSLYINGNKSAIPSSQVLSQPNYIRSCVITNFHPFLIDDGGAACMPLGDWWAMSETYGACLGWGDHSIIFLTNHGIYYCSDIGSCRLSSSVTPTRSQLISIHYHDDTLYALGDDGSIYKLLSRKEYDHYYKNRLVAGNVTDLSEMSSQWYWYPIHYFYGLDLSHSIVENMRVSLEEYPSLYLTLSDGEIQRWYRDEWNEVDRIVTRGYYLARSKDAVQVVSDRTGNIIRSSKGAREVATTTALYTIDEGWLVRTSNDLGNVPMRIDSNWVDLLPLEDGRVVGISSDRALALE